MPAFICRVKIGSALTVRRPFLGLIALLLFLVVSGLPAAEGQTLAQVFDVDETYAKSLSAGESVSFVWLVYNRDSSDVLLQARVDPGAGSEWSAAVSPRSLILQPGGSVEVNLSVTTGLSAMEESIAFTVTFALARAGDPAVNETFLRQATAELSPAPPPLPTGNLILGIWPNPLPPPFNSRAVTFVINVVIWSAIAGLAALVATPLLRRAFRRTETELDNVVLRIVRGPLILLLLTYGVVQSVAVLEPPIEVANTLFLIYNVILVAVLTWVAYRLFHGVLISFGRKAARSRRAAMLGRMLPLLNVVGAIVIFVGGAAALLAVFGYDLTAFLVGAGVLGIAIAFAAQESLSNFFSGIFLMLDQPFKEG
ncbi:MAG: mechanosensitive ion channel, partial [Thermoplasmata archaeon]|nr:mechanosensitive ion channel [Thermoplasmata archaeon]